MTKILGCFVLKYAEPHLPWEIQKIITDNLRSAQLKYLLSKFANKKWDWNFINRFKKYSVKVDCYLIKIMEIYNDQLIMVNISNECEEYVYDMESIIGPKVNTIETWIFSMVCREYKYIDYLIKNVINMDWMSLSYNESIKIEHILNHPYKDWDWYKLSKNKSIKIEYLLKYPVAHLKETERVKGITYLNWDMDGICANPNITIKMIKTHFPNYLQNYDYICLNPNITMKYINTNIAFLTDGNIMCIIKYSKIVMEFLEKYPKYLTLYTNQLSHNPNLTMEFVEKHIDLDWKWDYFICNTNFKFEYLIKFRKLRSIKLSISSILLCTTFSTKQKEFLLSD